MPKNKPDLLAEVQAAEKAVQLITSLVKDWPQFDTDEQVNGGDAVEYLEGMRNDAIAILTSIGYNVTKMRTDALHEGISYENLTVDLRSILDKTIATATSKPIPSGAAGEVKPTYDFEQLVAAAEASFTPLVRGNAVISGIEGRDAKTGESLTLGYYANPEASGVTVYVQHGAYTPEDQPEPELDAIAFEYFEIRPGFEDAEGCVASYRDEEEYASAKANHVGYIVREFWTLYGMSSGDLHAVYIGDFRTKAQAHQVMNAILAPMANAMGSIGAVIDNGGVDDDGTLNRAHDALEDFINQCSNSERV